MVGILCAVVDAVRPTLDDADVFDDTPEPEPAPAPEPAPEPVAAQPEPADEPEPESAAPEPPDAPPDTAEGWVEPDEKWRHQWVHIEGDRLAVRKPTAKGLSGLSLGSSQYLPDQKRAALTGLFIALHMSEASWLRVFTRLMDPDEDTYDDDTIGDLVNRIVELTTGQVAANGKVKGKTPATA